MTDKIRPLLKINALKRRRAERDLNLYAAKIREFESEIQTIKKTLIRARQNVLNATSQDAQIETASNWTDFETLERWELQQEAKIQVLAQHCAVMEPELARLKEALKVLIVREDTLLEMAKSERGTRQKAYDEKTAQMTQDLWVTAARKDSGQA